MLRVLTEEEELAGRKKSYQRLVPGRLFDLAGERYFITVERKEETVTAIELSAENAARILRGERCVESTLRFDDMRCLNVHPRV